MSIALIDYGAGNLASVSKGLLAAGADVVAPAAPDALRHATGIVVPGVGHFSSTVRLTSPWREAITDAVRRGVPVLGICLGMQWLFDGSEEAPEVRGFGYLPGQCSRLRPEAPLKVPHVGWNVLDTIRPGGILEGVREGAHVYFTHSYAAPVTEPCRARTTHGVPFAAVVECGAVAGVQFHPEKSGEAGLQILRNFVRATRP